MGAFFTAGRGRLALTAITLLAGGGFFLVDGLRGSNEPATFDATLADMREDFGDHARVVSVQIEDGIDWEVLDASGSVAQRSYTVDSQTRRNPTTGAYDTDTSREQTDSERAATPADEKRALLTLGELDPSALPRMCEETGIVEGFGSHRLQGKTWTFENNTGFQRYTASFDGTNVKLVKSRAGSTPYISTFACEL